MIKTSQTFQRSAGHPQRIAIDPSMLEHGRNLRLPKSRMKVCDYDAPAGLYVRQGLRLRYQAFPLASLAIRYANEELSLHELRSCTMEMDEDRFDGTQIRALYRFVRYR